MRVLSMPGPEAGSPLTPQVGSAPRTVRVKRPGALTTIQDDGRPGLAHLGVPRSGALDVAAHRLANRLVGNEETAPALETTLDGVALTFETEATAAVTGAFCRPRLDGVAVGWALPIYLRAGQTLDVGRAERGVRSYLAVSGGFEVARVLGSASTDLLSGLGTKPLAAGDVFRLGPPAGPSPAVDLNPYLLPADRIDLVVQLGPRDDWMDAGGLDILRTGTWSVSPESNRVALRLAGPPVGRSRDDELPSEGLVLGAIQCLPDGQLIVFLADHPTTGGYPVIGVVDARSIGACAQARPGTIVTFRLS